MLRSASSSASEAAAVGPLTQAVPKFIKTGGGSELPLWHQGVQSAAAGPTNSSSLSSSSSHISPSADYLDTLGIESPINSNAATERTISQQELDDMCDLSSTYSFFKDYTTTSSSNNAEAATASLVPIADPTQQATSQQQQPEQAKFKLVVDTPADNDGDIFLSTPPETLLPCLASQQLCALDEEANRSRQSSSTSSIGHNLFDSTPMTSPINDTFGNGSCSGDYDSHLMTQSSTANTSHNATTTGGSVDENVMTMMMMMMRCRTASRTDEAGFDESLIGHMQQFGSVEEEEQRDQTQPQDGLAGGTAATLDSFEEFFGMGSAAAPETDQQKQRRQQQQQRPRQLQPGFELGSISSADAAVAAAALLNPFTSVAQPVLHCNTGADYLNQNATNSAITSADFTRMMAESGAAAAAAVAAGAHSMNNPAAAGNPIDGPFEMPYPEHLVSPFMAAPVVPTLASQPQRGVGLGIVVPPGPIHSSLDLVSPVSASGPSPWSGLTCPASTTPSMLSQLPGTPVSSAVAPTRAASRHATATPPRTPTSRRPMLRRDSSRRSVASSNRSSKSYTNDDYDYDYNDDDALLDLAQEPTVPGEMIVRLDYTEGSGYYRGPTSYNKNDAAYENRGFCASLYSPDDDKDLEKPGTHNKGELIKLKCPDFAKNGEVVGLFGFLNFRPRRAWTRSRRQDKGSVAGDSKDDEAASPGRGKKKTKGEGAGMKRKGSLAGASTAATASTMTGAAADVESAAGGTTKIEKRRSLGSASKRKTSAAVAAAAAAKVLAERDSPATVLLTSKRSTRSKSRAALSSQKAAAEQLLLDKDDDEDMATDAVSGIKLETDSLFDGYAHV